MIDGLARSGHQFDQEARMRAVIERIRSSLVGGLLGWLLLLKRNVWRCLRCGHILDRA